MEENQNTPLQGAPALLTLMAVTMGMSAVATERDVQARVRELADVERDLMRVTGKASGPEALGAAKAWKVSHDALPAAQASLLALQVVEQARALDVLIESGKAAGKITSDALEKNCREIGTASHAQLRALIDTLPVVGGGTLKQQGTRELEPGLMVSEADHEMSRMLNVSVEDIARTRREDNNARKAG